MGKGGDHYDGLVEMIQERVLRYRPGHGTVWLEEIPQDASKRICEAITGDPEVIGLSIGEPWFGPARHLADFVAQLGAEFQGTCNPRETLCDVLRIVPPSRSDRGTIWPIIRLGGRP